MISAIIFILPFSVLAVAQDDFVYTYVFHLYYDSSKLVKDRDFETAFDLVAEEFVQQPVGQPEFNGEILSVNSRNLANFKFGLTSEVARTGKGKISVLAPYFTDAKTAVFYNANGDRLLTIDLAPYGPVCNDDGTCNSDVGENYQNCPNDCKKPSPSPTYQPSAPSVWQNMLVPILIAAAVLLLVVIWIIWVIIKKRKQTESDQFPPSIPPEVPPTIPPTTPIQ